MFLSLPLPPRSLFFCLFFTLCFSLFPAQAGRGRYDGGGRQDNTLCVLRFALCHFRSYVLHGISTVRPQAGTLAGTPRYIAPEMLRGESYGPKADVYSFAMVLNVGEAIFSDWSADSDLGVRGIRSNIGGNATSAQRSLIEACWNGQPDARPTFVEILSRLGIETGTPGSQTGGGAGSEWPDASGRPTTGDFVRLKVDKNGLSAGDICEVTQDDRDGRPYKLVRVECVIYRSA